MSEEKVVCRATRWFYWRAVALIVMFLGFGGYFFYDAVVGYPEKNLHYFMNKKFDEMGQEFTKKYQDAPAEWSKFVQSTSLDFPKEYPFPEGFDRQSKLPTILADASKMEKQGWYELWIDYTKEKGWGIQPAEVPYGADKIKEQWIAGSVCCLLGLIGVFILIRTHLRVMSFDGELLVSAGKMTSISQISQIDLRKWKSKGLAFAVTQKEGKKVNQRIDGMVYGGFEGKDGGPAECLMKLLLEKFSGEVIDFQEDESDDEKTEEEVKENENL